MCVFELLKRQTCLYWHQTNCVDCCRFYVKAVSNAGESYESNIVIARLARGSERQRVSDSSDSDILPDSDKDHDSSDIINTRRPRKRENRKHRKVRSPRSEKKTGRSGGETNPGEESVGSEEGGGRGASGQHQPPVPSSSGILTQPKLHMHRRTRSKEQSELSSLHSDSAPSTPSHHGEDSRPPSRSTPTPSRELSQTPVLTQPDVVHQRRAGSPARDLSFKSPSPSMDRRGGDRSSPGSQDGDRRKSATPPVSECAEETPVVLSETFTVDKARSFLHNLAAPPHDVATEDRASPDNGGFVKGHQRKRSKDLNAESGGAAPHKDRSSPDRGLGGNQTDPQATEEGSRVRTHRRTRSRDLNTPTPMDDARKEEDGGGNREREHCSTPVLDGRRRTNSRPSSPMIFEGPSLGSDQRDADPSGTELSRRMTTAENLAQRLSGLRKSPSPSSAPVGVRDQPEGEKKSPQHGNRSRKQSPSPDSLPDSQDDTPRPLSVRHRTHSLGSESDLVSVASGKQENQAGIVSSLLAKLQVFTRKQETTLRETSTRLRKRSNEEEERRRPSGRTRHISESDNDMSSDPGSHLPPRAPAASDSSSGSHSDDNKARSHRHRR